MSRALEQADIDDRRRDQRRGDRADAGDRCQAACGFILPGVSDDLSLECRNALGQRAE